MGPSNSTVWRDSISAQLLSFARLVIQRRFLVDSGGCGQDEADLVQYSQAVFESIPSETLCSRYTSMAIPTIIRLPFRASVRAIRQS